MYLYRLIFVFTWFFLTTTTSFCKFVSLNAKNITALNGFETKNCFITYVMINGHRYLVKQKKENNKQIAVVRDALAAYIAKDLKIAHKVEIIPFDKLFPGKINNEWPATIHTIAPGDTVRKLRHSIYSLLRLRQFWAHVQTFEEQGLTKQIINHMTWHEQLPVIVGLDLMIGNSDRHCGNLCYDPETDKFCAIDMDDTFNKDLCEIACKKLIIMMRDPQIVFSTDEIKALVRLKKTVVYFLENYKPNDLIKKMYHFAKKSGFSPGKKIYTPSIEKKLNNYAAMIAQTWLSARKLVAIISKIIDTHNYNHHHRHELIERE